MPVHDWTLVEAGIFHDFHHVWIAAIHHYLNGGAMPSDYYALAEQVVGPASPDMPTLFGYGWYPVNPDSLRSELQFRSRARRVRFASTPKPSSMHESRNRWSSGTSPGTRWSR